MEKKTVVIIIAIIVIAILAFSIYKFTGNPIVGGTLKGCVDTDNGQDYSVKGTASYTSDGVEYKDYCVGTGGLKEYYCINDKIRSQVQSCTCVDGACIE